jgi:hypothetical protein
VSYCDSALVPIIPAPPVKSKRRKGMAQMMGGADPKRKRQDFSHREADAKDVFLDLPLTEAIGRNHVVGGQLANSPEVHVLGPIDQPGELHIPDHAVTEIRHCDTLS